MFGPFLVSNARVRALPDQLRRDCSASLDRLLQAAAKDDRPESAVARWLLSESGAGLRERWAHQLEVEATRAVGFIWEGWDNAGKVDLPSDPYDRADAIMEAQISFPFRVHEFVDAVLQSPAMLPYIASKVRESLDRKLHEYDESADPDEMCEPMDLHILPSWEWLGGYLPPHEGDPDKWELVAVLDFGHEKAADGSAVKVPSRKVYRPKKPPDYLRAFTASLWETSWREEAERLRRNGPGLFYPVHSNLETALRSLPLNLKRTDSRQLQIPGLLPAVPEGVEALRCALEAATKVSPVLAHRTIRSIVKWGATAYFAGEGTELVLYSNGEHELLASRTPTGVDIYTRSGGLDFFSQAIGHTSKKDSPDDILRILSSHGAVWNTPRGRGGGSLISWDADGRNDWGKVSIRVGPLLLPGLHTKDDPLHPNDRLLVPTLSLPDMTPFNGRSVPKLCLMDWSAMATFARNRAELLECGSVFLDWRSIASGAGFGPRSNAPEQAVAHWETTPEEQNRIGARWVRLEGSPGSLTGRFTLVNLGEEGVALEMIRDGADRSARNRVRGRRNADRKHR